MSKILKYFKKNLIYWVVFFIPFLVYVYTLCPTISVYADAGEAPLFAYINGFIHPPGYPLFVLIVKLFQVLPFGSLAYRANFASAFIAAAAIPIFYLLSKKLLKKPFPAFIASLILAFSKDYWHLAIISEVFSLLAFFIILCLYLYLLWIDTKRKKYLYFFILAAGFGFAHHQTIIFVLFPLFVYFLISKQWKSLVLKDCLYCLLLFLTGFLPFLYIYFLAAPNNPVMNWNNPSTPQGLFNLVVRASYGTFKLVVNVQNSLYLTQLTGLLKLLFSNPPFLGIALFLLGAYASIKNNRKLFIFSIAVLVTVFVFQFFSGMPVNQPVQIQYLERFNIISTVFLVLLAGYGLSFLQTKTKSTKSKLYKKIVAPAICIIPLVYLVLNYPLVNQRNNYFADQLANDILVSTPENSILIVNDDGIINTLFYHRYVLNKRPDISYIVGGILAAKPTWYLDEIKQFYPGIILPDPTYDNRNFLAAFIKQNSLNKDIIFYIDDQEMELNISIPKIKQGLFWKYFDEYKLQTSAGSTLTAEDELLAFADKFEYLKQPTKFIRGSAEYSLVRPYSEFYMFLAQISHDNIEKSEKYYTKALEIKPDNFFVLLELGDDYIAHNQPEKAIARWKDALPYIEDSVLKTSVQNAINQVNFQLNNGQKEVFP